MGYLEGFLVIDCRQRAVEREFGSCMCIDG